jgi:hypothetical protein
MSIAHRVVVVLAVASLARCAVAQPLPLGEDFQVNTFTPGFQAEAAIAAGSAATVVVWTSADEDGYGYGIFGQRYGSGGASLGSEFQINTATTSSDIWPAVAMDAAGRFVVVWADLNDAKILGQRFVDDGSPLGSEFQVNTYTGMDRISSSVAADPNGNFMVVWGDYYGLLARRYDSTGTPLGSEQFLAQYGGNMDVAADASGQFIVVWPGVSTVVVGQRFDSTGAALGTEFQVEDAPYDPAPITISDAAVAVSESGDFAITWRRRIEPEDSSNPSTDVFARVYDSAGQPRGAAFVVSQKHQYNYFSDVGADASGDFVVVWSAYRNGGYDLDVLGRRISSSGRVIGDEFRVNSDTSASQLHPAIAFSDAGNFDIVWWNDPFPVAINTDVHARRFSTAITTPICTDGAIAADAQVKLAKLGTPTGDEKIGIKGVLQFGPGTPAVLDPATDGVQILVEDLGAGNAAIFDLTADTTPVPGGAGCGPDDGWKANGAGTTFTYKNKSGALPPGCAPGSANGLSLIKVKDKRAKGGGIAIKAKAKDANIPAVVGPLRFTVVLGASAAQGTAGECGGIPFAASECSAKATGMKCAR